MPERQSRPQLKWTTRSELKLLAIPLRPNRFPVGIKANSTERCLVVEETPRASYLVKLSYASRCRACEKGRSTWLVMESGSNCGGGGKARGNGNDSRRWQGFCSCRLPGGSDEELIVSCRIVFTGILWIILKFIARFIPRRRVGFCKNSFCWSALRNTFPVDVICKEKLRFCEQSILLEMDVLRLSHYQNAISTPGKWEEFQVIKVIKWKSNFEQQMHMSQYVEENDYTSRELNFSGPVD